MHFDNERENHQQKPTIILMIIILRIASFMKKNKTARMTFHSVINAETMKYYLQIITIMLSGVVFFSTHLHAFVYHLVDNSFCGIVSQAITFITYMNCMTIITKKTLQQNQQQYNKSKKKYQQRE